MDHDRSDLLCAWSERVAALAVRLESPRPLVLGLVGLSLADETGDGEALLVAPLHRRSAEKLDADPMRLFDEAAGADRPPRAPAGCATRATPTTRWRTPGTSRTATATTSATCGPPAPRAAIARPAS